MPDRQDIAVTLAERDDINVALAEVGDLSLTAAADSHGKGDLTGVEPGNLALFLLLH